MGPLPGEIVAPILAAQGKRQPSVQFSFKGINWELDLKQKTMKDKDVAAQKIGRIVRRWSIVEEITDVPFVREPNFGELTVPHMARYVNEEKAPIFRSLGKS